MSKRRVLLLSNYNPQNDQKYGQNSKSSKNGKVSTDKTHSWNDKRWSMPWKVQGLRSEEMHSPSLFGPVRIAKMPRIGRQHLSIKEWYRRQAPGTVKFQWPTKCNEEAFYNVMNETRIDPMLRIHFNIVEFIRDNKSIGFPRRHLLLSQFTRHRWGNLMLTSEQGVHYWKRRTDKKLQSWQVNCLFFIGYYCSMLARCMIPFFLIYFLFWSKPDFFRYNWLFAFDHFNVD